MLRELNGGAQTHKARQRKKRIIFIRRLLGGGLIVGLLMVGSGLAFAWYQAQSNPITVTQTPASKKTLPAATVREFADDTPVGVSIQSLSAPLRAGQNASLTIKTLPTAACSVKVTYKDQESKDAGLIPKNADDFGAVTWTWTVEVSRPSGKWPVEVMCAHGKMSGYVKTELEIQT